MPTVYPEIKSGQLSPSARAGVGRRRSHFCRFRAGLSGVNGAHNKIRSVSLTHSQAAAGGAGTKPHSVRGGSIGFSMAKVLNDDAALTSVYQRSKLSGCSLSKAQMQCVHLIGPTPDID